MKAPATLDMQRTGTLGGRQTKMTFDPENVAHLMSLLTNLYSDILLAMIREYSNNARDAHVEAGNSAPIEVTLPSTWAPVLKIKDRGVGMDADTIDTVYSKYGASTKRDTNEQTGMMGIGAKCALAYTNQFTVTAVKDGVKTVVMVSKVEDGTGVMETVSESPTTEPNGVEIAIPIKREDIARMRQTAASFFLYWKEGTVLVDGEAPLHVKGEQITPNIMTVVGHGPDLAVMGDIAYPVEGGLYDGFRPANGRFRVVATIPLGSASITPSREAFIYSPETKATLAKVKNEFLAALNAKIQDKINKAPDHPTALREYIQATRTYGTTVVSAMTYKGEKIPLRWDVDHTIFYPHYSHRMVQQGTRLDHDDIDGKIIVTNFSGVTITPRHREKMRKWAMDNNHAATTPFLLCPAVPGEPWVKGKGTVEWADIVAVKLPSGGKAAVRTYNIYTAAKGYHSIDADDLDTKGDVYYISPKDKLHSSNMKIIMDFVGGGTLVVLGQNRWDRLKREAPKAQRLVSVIPIKANAARDGLTPDDLTVMGLMRTSSTKELLARLDPAKIKDPEIVRWIGLAKGLTTSPTMVHYEKAKQAMRAAKLYFADANSNAPHNVFAKYPLASAGYSPNAKHVTLYINAVYTAIQNGEF